MTLDKLVSTTALCLFDTNTLIEQPEQVVRFENEIKYCLGNIDYISLELDKAMDNGNLEKVLSDTLKSIETIIGKKNLSMIIKKKKSESINEIEYVIKDTETTNRKKYNPQMFYTVDFLMDIFYHYAKSEEININVSSFMQDFFEALNSAMFVIFNLAIVNDNLSIISKEKQFKANVEKLQYLRIFNSNVSVEYI